MVFLIAFLPAFVVFVVGIASRKRSTTLTVAIIAAILGLATGNPFYAGLDGAAVMVAFWLTSFAWREKESDASKARLAPRSVATPPAAPPPILPTPTPQLLSVPPTASFTVSDVIVWVGLGVAGVFFLFLHFTGPKQKTSLLPPSQPLLNIPVSAKVTPVKTLKPKKPPHRAPKKVRRPVENPVPNIKNCLTIVDDMEMARCMEKAK